MIKYRDILEEICKEENIKITHLSSGWLHLLEKDNKKEYIAGFNFNLNSNAVAKILDDKYAFYELAKFNDYPIIEHNIIFKNTDESFIKELFYKYKENVVVKANIGSRGAQVFHINSLENLFKKVEELLSKNYSISICPYVDIKSEYRIVVLKGKCELIYEKVKPIIVGDGKSSIKELLSKFNPYFFNKKKGLSEDVLEKGEIYEYNWQFNLSKGATVNLNINKDLCKELQNLSSNLAQDIGIDFCSIDIIVDEKNDIYLMEANSGVMMTNFTNIVPNGKEITKKIYAKAIKLMFAE